MDDSASTSARAPLASTTLSALTLLALVARTIYVSFVRCLIMNDVPLHVSALLSIACGYLLLSTSRLCLACLLSWLASALFLHNFIASSTWRFGPHFRTLGLALANATATVVLPIQIYHGRELALANKAIGVLLVILTLLALFVMTFLPVPSMYALGGKYRRIGTSSFNIQMELPATAYCYNGKQQYSMCVQAWYPVHTEATKTLWSFFFPSAGVLWTSGHPQEQVTEAEILLQHIADAAKLPSLLFSHLALARSNADFFSSTDKGIYPCPFASGYPCIIQSHGLYSWRQIFTSTAEALASNGFVVFSIDHSPSALITRPFEDLRNSEKFDRPIKPAFSGIAMHHEDRARYTEGLDRQAREIMFLIDHLSHSDVARSFSINPALISVCGHSHGGGAAALVASRDKRVIAAAVLDADICSLPMSDRKQGSAGAACVSISSHRWHITPDQAPFRKEFCHSSKSSGKMSVRVTLLESDHQNFTDSPFLAARSLLTSQNCLGSKVDAQLATRLVDQLLVRFFARTCHLRSSLAASSLAETQLVAKSAMSDRGVFLDYCFACSNNGDFAVQAFPTRLNTFLDKYLVDTDTLSKDFHCDILYNLYNQAEAPITSSKDASSKTASSFENSVTQIEEVCIKANGYKDE